MRSKDKTWSTSSSTITAAVLNASHVREVIDSNPWYYLANSRHQPYVKDSSPFQHYDGSGSDPIINYSSSKTRRTTPVAQVELDVVGYEEVTVDAEKPNMDLALFAMMGDTDVWEPVTNDDGSIKVFNEKVKTVSTNNKTKIEADLVCPETGNTVAGIPEVAHNNTINNCDGESLEYRYTYKFKFKSSKPTSIVVKDMASWYPHLYLDIRDIPYVRATEPDRYKEALTTTTMDTRFKVSLFNELQESINTNPGLPWTFDKYYMVEPLTEMKKEDFARFIATRLDTDSRMKKKSGSFSKIFTVVLLIVAIIVSVMYPPLAAPMWQSWAAFGAVLAAGQMLAMMLQLPVRSSEMKLIGDTAMVVGISTFFASVYTAWQTAAKDVTAKGLEETFVNTAMQMVENYMTTAGNYLGMVQKAVSFGSQEYNKDIAGKIEDVNEDLAVVNELVEEQEYEQRNRRYLEVAGLEQQIHFSDPETDRSSWLQHYIDKQTGGHEATGAYIL